MMKSYGYIYIYKEGMNQLKKNYIFMQYEGEHSIFVKFYKKVSYDY